MDSNYLLELINEAQNRGGGLLLNFNDKPAAVVLTIEKYNQLASRTFNPAEPGFMAESSAAAAEPSASLFDTASKRKVLVTGGAGYIGAHLVYELLDSGLEVVVLDNLSTGLKDNVPAGAVFIEGDLKDTNLLRDLFASYNFDPVFHLAASLEVGESVQKPEQYFENNVFNTANLLSVMAEANVKNIIFSSTAAVYGPQEQMPISESAPLRPNNPYGATKLLAERIIKYYSTHLGFNAIVFRFFNACGCRPQGNVKATHNSHLLYNVLQVAKGDKPQILVNGNDYPTFDGTCIRDYVHVMDIAKAHLLAYKSLGQGESFKIYNIGTGKGCSVTQMINTASEVLNKIIPMEIGPKRAGDDAITVADNSKLKHELGYELQFSDLPNIITTGWKQMSS